MFKYFLTVILLLNQLLAINPIEAKESPVVLCVCDHGDQITLENGTCNCQSNLEQNEIITEDTFIKKKIMHCFELPISSGAVATKCFGHFDASLFFKAIALPNYKSDISYFLSKFEYFNRPNFLLNRIFRLTILNDQNTHILIFISQPLSILRC